MRQSQPISSTQAAKPRTVSRRGLWRRRIKTTVGTLLLMLVVFLFGVWQIAQSRSFQFFGTIVDRVETSKPRVALTFDDGPTEGRTQAVLNALREHNVRATFFLTGADIQKRPHLAELIVDQGHEVGNHSFSHRRMLFTDYDDVAREITATNALIRKAGQRDPIHFRPPYGKKWINLPLYLSVNDITTVTWDIEPETDRRIAADSDLITQHVLERARPGSIILMHVMYESRAPSMAAVPDIIQGLKARGFELVTVNELLDSRG